MVSINQKNFIMGFEQFAIDSIKSNRSLQSKQNSFGLAADNYKHCNLNIKKAKVDEGYMAHLEREARREALVIWIFSIVIGMMMVYGLVF